MSIKKDDETIELLKEGHVPDTLTLVHWVDITYFGNLDLGYRVGSCEFMTPGFILRIEDKIIYLQQTWEVNHPKEISIERTGNQLLKIPIGAIIKIYKYNVEVEELKEAKKRKRRKQKNAK